MTATTPAEAAALAVGETPPLYTIAVRALCEFTAREGDLDLRFTPAPTAQQGIEGHAIVAARRGLGYQPERLLEGRVGTVHVRGRADGWDPQRQRVEEVKTHKGRLDAIPANHRALHRAQLWCYGALISAELDLPEVELALVYFDVGTQRETVITERASAGRAARAPRDAGGPLRRVGRPGAGPPRRPRRGAGRARLPAPRIPSGPARAGRGRVPRRGAGPLRAGPGAHGHRQDRRHAVPAAQGDARAASRPRVLHGGQELGARAGARGR